MSVQATSQSDAFTKTGFRNYKKATESFQKHQSTKCHLEALERYVTAPKTDDVLDQLSSKHAEQRKYSRKMLLKIITNIRFLGKFRDVKYILYSKPSRCLVISHQQRMKTLAQILWKINHS